jgi:hypothetical protein
VIVEMRTYRLKPGTVPIALERIALGLTERTQLSPLAGLWQTEIGRLHQIIHIWPYSGLAEREQVRGQFGPLKNWPARTGEWTESSETKIMHPAPFAPALTPRDIGPVYEIRTDTYHSGQLGAIIESWTRMFQGQRPPPSLVGAWHTDLGPMNQWIHIWGFRNLEARAAEMQKYDASLHTGGRSLADIFVKQETVICRPASFSPLQ